MYSILFYSISSAIIILILIAGYRWHKDRYKGFDDLQENEHDELDPEQVMHKRTMGGDIQLKNHEIEAHESQTRAEKRKIEKKWKQDINSGRVIMVVSSEGEELGYIPKADANELVEADKGHIVDGRYYEN